MKNLKMFEVLRIVLISEICMVGNCPQNETHLAHRIDLLKIYYNKMALADLSLFF